MITIKNKKEIKIMKEGGQILKKVFEILEEEVKPGISTEHLNNMAERIIFENNAKPSFLGYQGFPKSICTSINEEVVHGIPDLKKLKEGDIVGLDIGVLYKGLHTDAALTLPVGKISKKDEELIGATKKSLLEGLKQIKAGRRIGDLSSVIQKVIEKEGFSVVRECTGHGVGRSLHEDPSIPNYGDPGTGLILEEGLTLAIEPMANIGDFKVETLDDGWTIKTIDNQKSAHFEFTVLVLKKGFENLTPIEI